MNPLSVVAALNASLEIADKLLPIVKDFQSQGLITKERQAEIRAKVDALRATAGELFSGPEWEPSDRPPV